MGRALVVAVLALAALAVADGVRRVGSERIVVREPEAPARAEVALAPGRPQGHAAVSDGRLTRTRVLHGGEEVLSRDQIDAAFPARLRGELFDVAHVAVAPDGTLALAVYRFPATGRVRTGVQLWRGRRLVAAFPVPSGSFGRGIGFSEDGGLVATFSAARPEATLFDRSGRRAGSVALR